MLSSARLEVISQVATHGSIAGAAAALELTPSAVSHQLARLEQELGVALVERGGRSIRLTDAGRRMAQHADAIAELMRTAQEDVIAHSMGQGGRIRLGFFTSSGLRLVPHALSRFVATHPETELGLSPGQTHELTPLLRKGDLDIALVFDHSFTPYPVPDELEVTPILRDPQFLVLPRHHPLAGRSEIALEELRDDPWVATNGLPPAPSVVESLCRSAGFVPNVRCRTDHYEVIIGMVRAGLGVGLVPALSLPSGDQIATASIAGVEVARRISVLTRKSNPNPLVEPLTDLLRDAANSIQPVLFRSPSTE